MSSQVHEDDTPLEDVGQLVQFMAQGGKPVDQWVIGTEHEKLGWWPARGLPPDYHDPRGIGALLESLADTAGWTATREGPAIIALARDRATLTLEPGGQFELSGAPLRTLAETAVELDAHFTEISAHSAPLGIEWSGLGLMPWGTPDAMPMMPKARYGILDRHLRTRGGHGIHMMRQTCTVQANYDYADEVDAFEKFRVSIYLQPFVMAAFANSPVVDGVLVPERTYRGRIWGDTDPQRCVLPLRFMAPGATFADYVAWAIDIPLLFIHRDGAYLDCEGLSLRAFMERGWRGYRASVGDYALHLSTLFPEVRLKQHLEVRAADMGDRDQVLALPAFHAGLLYDDRARGAAMALLSSFTPARWATLWKRVPVEGLSAEIDGTALREIGVDLIRLAREGLSRWEPGSASMLDGLGEAVAQGRCPADLIREQYDGDPSGVLRRSRVA